MERLTIKINDNMAVLNNCKLNVIKVFSQENGDYVIGDAIDRLAEYENIGMEPSEIRAMIKYHDDESEVKNI